MATRSDRLQERAEHQDADESEGWMPSDPYEIEGIYFPTPEEARAIFDARARYELGISGEEFLRRWDNGEYQPVPDDTEGRKVERVAMMMSFAGRKTT